jgi:hypothetical protein
MSTTFTTCWRQPRNHDLAAIAVVRVDTAAGGRSTTTELRRFVYRFVESDAHGNQARQAEATAQAFAFRDQARLDYLTATHTAFSTFAALVEAPYTPTLRQFWDSKRLADAYDAAQAARGSSRRCSRS